MIFQRIHWVLQNREVAKEKPDSTTRIFIIGDSFTQGAGAPFDSTYPRQLELLIEEHCSHRPVEIFNFGLSGSDIFFYTQLLEDVLMDYEVDMILFTMSDWDAEDVYKRGGRERFRSDGMCADRKAPKIEYVFERSHLARALLRRMGYNHLMITNKKHSKVLDDAVTKIFEEVDYLNSYCKDKGIDCYFAYHPSPKLIEAHNKQLQVDMSADIYDILKPTGGGRLAQDHRIIDLTPHLSRSLSGLDFNEYAWRLDTHYNSKGYQIIAGACYDELVNKLEALPCE